MAIIGETRPVTEVTIVASDGINGTINNPTTTPEIVLSLDDITPNSVAAVGTITGSNLSGTNTGDQNVFSTISVSGQSDIVADGTGDTLTLVAGSNVTITTDASTDTITISATGGGGGSGTVTSVSVTTANGVSGSVATPTTTPAITLTLGDITPTSVAAVGTVSGSNLSGTNTGDQDLSALEGKTIETMGTHITFSTRVIYNPVTAGTGNITADYTNARAGVVQKIYHNDSVVPTVPAGWVLVGAGSYVTGVLNIIYATWVNGTTVEYWIVQ